MEVDLGNVFLRSKTQIEQSAQRQQSMDVCIVILDYNIVKITLCQVSIECIPVL